MGDLFAGGLDLDVLGLGVGGAVGEAPLPAPAHRRSAHMPSGIERFGSAWQVLAGRASAASRKERKAAQEEQHRQSQLDGSKHAWDSMVLREGDKADVGGAASSSALHANQYTVPGQYARSAFSVAPRSPCCSIHQSFRAATVVPSKFGDRLWPIFAKTLDF